MGRSGKRMSRFEPIAAGMRKYFSPHSPAAPAVFYRVLNRTRGTVLATQLELAHTGPARRKGLLGRDGLSAGGGLWIAPCESVHTFFMRFPIDLVYLDRKLRIRKVRSRVGPWRISACLTASSILELPVGVIGDSRTERGDILQIEPVSQG
jgi:uncharacterized protein